MMNMSELQVKLTLQHEQGRGKMEVDHGPEIPLAGTSDDYGLAPYQLLLGALGYCLFWTLRDVLVKQKIEFGEIEVDMRGDKKAEGITHLDWATVHFQIETAEANNSKVAKAVELAKKYCSIYYTLQHVARIEVTYDLKWK
jgi:putative redox protein